MTHLINLTPHTINLSNEDGTPNAITLEPADNPARVNIRERRVGRLNLGQQFVNIHKTFASGIENLPERREGVCFVVSRQVAEAAPERDDLFITHGAIRDSNGRIIGVKGIAQIENNPLIWIVTEMGVFHIDEHDNSNPGHGVEIDRFDSKEKAEQFMSSLTIE